MRIVFRVDASVTIGAGHVMRCLTLANALRERGAQPLFVCRPHEGHLCELISARGFDLAVLSPPQLGLAGYGAWLGADWQSDAEETRCVLHGLESRPEWLVADHYALDASWESALRPHVGKLMAIDDLADRPHDSDLLLDQNHHTIGAARYARLAPAAELLLGPNYALLRSDFAVCRAQLRERTGEVRKLLVFLGGSDSDDVSSKVLRALAARDGDALAVDVIAGKSNPHLHALRVHCARIGARLLTQVDDMAARMADADLAIGATGVATWERAALGLPTLAVSVAENQREIARNAHALGLLRWLGDEAAIDEAAWSAAIDWACANPEALREQSRSGMKVVDGHGARRVVECMHAHQHRLH